MQNKPNVKMGKIATSTAPIKAYVDKQRTMNNKRYSKQTQSKPISNAETGQWCEKSHPTGLQDLLRLPDERWPRACRASQ
jgi:hypothetical protein